MPQRFEVQIGRLIRESTEVIVEIPDGKDRAWLEARLSDVYDQHEGAVDMWEADTDWGQGESDSHCVFDNPPDEDSELPVIVLEDDNADDEDGDEDS